MSDEVAVIVGTVKAWSTTASGQHVIEVTEPNKQYPRKVRTKDNDLFAQITASAQAYPQNAFAFQCGVSHGDYQGKPVQYYWINGWAWAEQGQQTYIPGAQQAQPQAAPAPAPQAPPPPPQQQGNLNPQAQMPPPPPPSAQTQSGDPDEREYRIMRQHAMSDAISLLPYVGEEDRTFAGAVRIAETLVKYYREGTKWQTEPVPAPAAPAQQDAPDPDDIPF